MFRTREEEEILKIFKHRQLLKMFRSTLTSISNLWLNKLHVTASAAFQGSEFNFDITVFELNGTNTSLTIYDFWEVKQSQKLVDEFLTAIKTDDFKKVKSAKNRL